ncbi:DUF2490 domain-containing protein [Hymenobacter sp. GOD-10R]|uniref:DUF2490 domain-containing protein n=1 Tax=Hymenobacter sp. GOD-10R TaxID=3093922 RepID=UPI002D76DB58|nr:DUF2490 domain-containing protein [Hymenobacter sp. GOD-10R]WRQ29514.1 DUF2490 domain-containing protein [Hymenobacter sp. GOD-10R]
MPAFSPNVAKRYLALATLAFSLSTAAYGQNTTEGRISDRNNNAWLMFYSDARVSQRWSIHTEFQYRRTHFLRDPQQYFYRAGLNYHASDKLMLTAGYVYLLSLPYGDYPDSGRSHERRFYQQLQLDETYGKLGVMHRFRQEQRWLRDAGANTYKFSNRSRYRIQLTLPIKGKDGDPNTVYVTTYDDIFINYGPNVKQNIFNQNRLYGALGYQFTPATSLELGYLYQIVQHDDGQVFEYNHTLQAGLTVNPDFRKNKP